MASCSNRCFELAPLAIAASVDNYEDPLNVGSKSPDSPYIYSPLQPWQTRVIRLYPPGASANSQWSEDQLQADLLIVELLDTGMDGVIITGTSEVIEYIAVSYTWGDPDLDDVLICGHAAKSISRGNTAMLKALQHPSKPVHLWIDAICINQKDRDEKSRQVSRMLNIYQKAQSVTAWIGQADDETALAFACLSERKALNAKVTSSHHSPSCHDQLVRIHNALIRLYSRPWLRRTWVRQEVYGARHLVIQCGAHEASLDQYARGASLIELIRKELPDRLQSNHEFLAISSLLEEATLNTRVPGNGVKPPRSLTEVLLKSREFAVTEEKDTFYAILGMCNVETASTARTGQRYASRNAILVDYSDSKSSSAVFNDAARYIIGRRGDCSELAGLWHSYTKSELHNEGLASWAVDWRSGLLPAQHTEVVMKGLRLFRPFRAYEERMIAHCCPLSTPTPQYAGDAPTLAYDWHWPETTSSDPCLLLAKARVLNYIAHLTDLTCGVTDFLAHRDREFDIGSAGNSIHSWETPRPGSSMLRFHGFRKYNSSEHRWRLAVLGVADNHPLCLVPATALKGDLVIAIAPDILPMLVRSDQRDDTGGGLFESDDPYDKVPSSKPPSIEDLHPEISHWLNGVLLLLVSATFNGYVFFADSNISGKAVTITSICHGVILAPLLLNRSRFLLRRMEYWCTPQEKMLIEEDPATWWRRLDILNVLLCCGLLIFHSIMMPSSKGSERVEHVVFSIYLAVNLAATIFNLLWYWYRVFDEEITVGIRRQAVLKHLDNVTRTAGDTFEFQGPLFILAGAPRRWDWVRDPFYWVRRRIVMRNNRTKGRKFVDMSRFDELYREIFVEPPERIASVRPLQELKLR